MEKQILELRKKVLKRQRRSRGRGGYGTEIRGAAATLASSWCEAGGSQRELAERLGVSKQTLATWSRRGSRLRAVEVIDDARTPVGSAPTRVDLPGGVQVVGLTLVEIAELSRRLR